MLVLGIGLVVWLVERAGPAHVADVLLAAGVYLPIIIALESTFLLTDSLALRGLLGSSARAVPLSAWVRSATIAYAMMVLLPAGRAAGEIGRAGSISPYLDKGTAALATARLNGAYMFANAAMSLAASVVAARVAGPTSWLAILTFLNFVATSALGAALVAIPKSTRLKAWLRRRFPSFAEGSYKELFTEADQPVPVRAAFVCFLARAAQAVQYGVVLVAVGGTVTVSRAVITLGVHLVGASAGDMVPNQLGVNEGAYAAFAEWMGLAGAPERALSVALLVRIAQLSLALACLVTASLLARKAPVVDAPAVPEGATRG